ncbi:MAG TPA: VOC family protein [Propionibacteriaceae bacterium]
MELDHVLIPLADLSKAVTGFERRYGLVSVEGGRHTDWGTANRIVPLGDSYLELVAVVDPAEASQSAFGRWVANARAGQPLGWAVRTDDLAAVAGRLGLNVGSGSRFTATGELLRWQIAGVERAMAEPWLPFFVEWAVESRLPGRIDVEHPTAATGIKRLIVAGEPQRLSSWLDGHRLPVTLADRGSGVLGVVLSTRSGEIVVGSKSQ